MESREVKTANQVIYCWSVLVKINSMNTIYFLCLTILNWTEKKEDGLLYLIGFWVDEHLKGHKSELFCGSV